MTNAELATVSPSIAHIAKRFKFDAAHYLKGLPDDHPCSRMHGHTYEVELQLVGPVSDLTGFVVDYADIATAWKEIRGLIDHRTLNDVPGLQSQPTTERLAAWVIAKLAGHPTFVRDNPIPESHRAGFPKVCTLLERVLVKESSTTWCELKVTDAFDIDGFPTRYLAPWKRWGTANHWWVQWARCGFTRTLTDGVSPYFDAGFKFV